MKFKLVDIKVTGSIKNTSKVDLNVTGFLEQVDEPPPIPGWPNEPTGFKSIADYGFTDSPDALVNGDFAIGSSGFRIIYNSPPGSIFGPETGPPFEGTPKGWVVGNNYADAPKSPTPAFDWVYPKGMRLGTAGATVYKPVSGREIYLAWWSKITDPFDFSTNGQKMIFLFNGGLSGDTGQVFLCIGPDMQIGCMPEYPDPPPSSPQYRIRWPNRNVGQALFTPGKWHLTEWYAKILENSGDANLTKWWVDGILQGEYTDIWNKEGFVELKISPTFGGNGDVYKTKEDKWSVDHLYVSVPA